MAMPQRLINSIHNSLIKKAKTLAVAESCTGGLASALLTQLSGSSSYFILGIIAYSNAAKKGALKIPLPLIKKYGAVSEKVACLMAEKIRKIAGSDLGIGITGIAGPSGGTPGKPVGTVFIAVSGKNKKICRRFLFSGNRSKIRNKAALRSLALLQALILR